MGRKTKPEAEREVVEETARGAQVIARERRIATTVLAAEDDLQAAARAARLLAAALDAEDRHLNIEDATGAAADIADRLTAACQLLYGVSA